MSNLKTSGKATKDLSLKDLSEIIVDYNEAITKSIRIFEEQTGLEVDEISIYEHDREGDFKKFAAINVKNPLVK